MPKVNADPEKLRQLAKTLTASAQQFEQLARGLQRSLAATEWKDAERQRFETEFRETLRSVPNIAERLRQNAVHLQKKAEALERFHSR